MLNKIKENRKKKKDLVIEFEYFNPCILSFLNVCNIFPTNEMRIWIHNVNIACMFYV